MDVGTLPPLLLVLWIIWQKTKLLFYAKAQNEQTLLWMVDVAAYYGQEYDLFMAADQAISWNYKIDMVNENCMISPPPGRMGLGVRGCRTSV